MPHSKELERAHWVWEALKKENAIDPTEPTPAYLATAITATAEFIASELHREELEAHPELIEDAYLARRSCS